MRRYSSSYAGNSIRRNSPLSTEDIYRYAPSVYATSQHESRSDKYVYIPTFEILKALENEGFFPFFATQGKSRIEGKTEFTKHMLRLRHVNNFSKGEETGEIILMNSHDGTSSYRIMAGFYRFVCSNGLIVGDDIADYRIHHKGNIKDEVINATYDVSGNLEKSKIDIDKFKAIDLKPSEQQVFAESSLMIKYDKDESPINGRQLLNLRRFEDKKTDLWTTFNKVQENMLQGGIRGRTQTGKRTSTRKVKSIDNNVKLNRALWNLTTAMAELKS